MTSVAELKRGEYAQLAFSSITERIGESRKTFFSSLLGVAGAYETGLARRYGDGRTCLARNSSGCSLFSLKISYTQ
jgi:hypothetical protein